MLSDWVGCPEPWLFRVWGRPTRVYFQCNPWRPQLREWGASLVHPYPQPRRPQLHLCGEHRSFRSPLESLPIFPSLWVQTYRRQMETWGPEEAFLKVQWRHQQHLFSLGLSCNTGAWLTLFSAPPNRLSSCPRCTSLVLDPGSEELCLWSMKDMDSFHWPRVWSSSPGLMSTASRSLWAMGAVAAEADCLGPPSGAGIPAHKSLFWLSSRLHPYCSLSPFPQLLHFTRFLIDSCFVC